MKTTDLIKEVADSVRDLLIEKNISYGDSATNPKNIFAKGNAIESLCARIDDKLSRISNKGINDETEDTVTDLIGYLILLKVAIKKSESIEDGHYIGNAQKMCKCENCTCHENIWQETTTST